MNQQVRGLKIKVATVIQFEAESMPAWLVSLLIIVIASVIAMVGLC